MSVIWEKLRTLNCWLSLSDTRNVYTEMKLTNDVLFPEYLNNVYSWPVNWQLLISSKKWNIVGIGKPTINSSNYQYYLDHEHIIMSACMSDLGVLIDSRLCFSDHVTNITCSHNSFFFHCTHVFMYSEKRIMWAHQNTPTAQRKKIVQTNVVM